MPFSSNKLIIMLRGTAPDKLSPGEFVSGSVHLDNAKPLSVSELRITLYGLAHTYIFRKYVFSFAFADWSGQGLLFQRIIVLLAEPTTLPAGQHRFDFTFQIPEATEPMRENWKNFMKWRERPPFPGKDSPSHPLPPSMKLSGRQMFGYTEGGVVYRLDATMQKGPESKWWSISPQDASALTIMPSRLSWQEDITCQEFSQTLASSSGPFRLSLNVPRAAVQEDALPVAMKVETCDGIVLEGFEATVHTVYLARARSLIWPEKRSKSTFSYSLMSWKNGRVVLGSEYLMVDPRCKLPDSIPVEFTTINIACLSHWLQVKFTLRFPNDGKKIKGEFNNMPIQVLSRKLKTPQDQDAVAEARNWFNGEVMNADQYREWAGRKKR